MASLLVSQLVPHVADRQKTLMCGVRPYHMAMDKPSLSTFQTRQQR
jgi:hypothetical protein